jgi:hypothetical protein
MNIKVNAIPDVPVVSNVALCAGVTSSALTASALGGHSLLWYGTNASGGVASGSAPSPNTSTAGLTNFYVSQSNNNTSCESPRTKIAVTVNAVPVAPVVSSTSYCVGSTASALSATSSTGNSLIWYGIYPSGGVSTSAAPIPSTNASGSTDYYVSQNNSITGCESPRAKLTVTVNSVPASPAVSALSYCAGVTAPALTATVDAGSSLKWYGTNATGGTSSTTAPTPTLTTAGIFNYYVSQSNATSGCESPRAKLAVTVNAIPDVPVVSNVALCVGGTSSALTASALGGHSLLWYGTSATGGVASGSAPIPTANGVGSTDYYVSQSNNSTSCESNRTKITVSVASAPSAPSISRDLSGNLVSSATSGNQWYKNGTEIVGATSMLYKPTEVANYAVKVLGNCVSPMSTTYYFLITDIINISTSEYIKVAPNPFVNNINIDFVLQGYPKVNLDVFSLATGNKVYSQGGLYTGSKIALGQLSAGVYIFHIGSTDGKLNYQFKIMKL